MLNLSKILLAVGLLSSSTLYAAYDAEAGKKLSATCIGCHGPAGISMNPIWPNLAGQKRDYLAKQLLAFKSGERKDPLMNPIASAISASDMEALVEYYSTLPR
jgi:cytochrome c553